MKITLICSCGLLIEQDGQKLLLDGLTDRLPPYEPTRPEDQESILLGRAPFDGLTAVACTHLHPDHWSPTLVARFRRRNPEVAVLEPEAGGFSAGAFTLTFFPIPHVPVPPRFAIGQNFAVRITVGGKTVYAAGDCASMVPPHEAALDGYRADAAFWNGQMLSFAPTRAFLCRAAARNFIYHIPVDPRDVSGIRRKCERNLARFREELQSVTLLESYPTVIEL